MSGHNATEGTTMMRLLAQRVPLTLLLDLFCPPDAEELYAAEGGRRLDLVASYPPPPSGD